MASRTRSFDHWHAQDGLPSRAAPLRLKGLQHVCRLYPTTHKRQIALIREARAARLREHGHGLAQSESEDCNLVEGTLGHRCR
jgi:hypothetical protein